MLKKSFVLDKKLCDVPGFQKYLTPSVLLGLILLLGMMLRLYNLGTESYWIDEMSTVVEGQQSIQQLLASGRLDQPPAYYLPFHFWVQFFGTTEVSTRSFSTLTGIGSIILIYLIGRELFGKSVGLLSAFLMSISQFQVYYSQQARYYGFFEFLTLLSFLFFILALSSKRRIYFMLYWMSSVIMVYSHAYGLFILVAQGIFFILQWKKYKDMLAAWFVCQMIILLVIIPYFYPMVFEGGGVGGVVDTNIGGIAPPSLLDPLRSIYRFIMSARGDRNWEVMLLNYAVAAVFFALGIWIYAVRQGLETFLNAARSWFAGLQKVQDLKNKILLLTCWLLCPIMIPFIVSLVFLPIYLDRYTISAAPAMYLLLALGIFSSRKAIPIAVSLGALVIMIAPSLSHYYVTDVHEQWKEVAEYVGGNSNPSDVIIFAPNQGIGIEQKTFNWYYKGDLQNYGLGTNLIDSVAISDALEPILSVHDRLWVIIRDNPNASSDRYASFFLDPDQSAMHLIDERHFVEISVYLLKLSK